MEHKKLYLVKGFSCSNVMDFNFSIDAFYSQEEAEKCIAELKKQFELSASFIRFADKQFGEDDLKMPVYSIEEIDIGKRNEYLKIMQENPHLWM